MEQIAQSISLIGIMALLACLILIPVFLRNRLQQKQVDVIAAAIERGADLEKVRSGIRSERVGDINGNWKAGIVLISIGAALLLLGTIPDLIKNGMNDAGQFAPLLFIILGGVLMYIHKSVVGDVVKHNK